MCHHEVFGQNYLTNVTQPHSSVSRLWDKNVSPAINLDP